MKRLSLTIGEPASHPLTRQALAIAGDKIAEAVANYLDSDVVFGVKDSLIRGLEEVTGGVTPDGHRVEGAVKLLHYDFVLAPAKAVA